MTVIKINWMLNMAVQIGQGNDFGLHWTRVLPLFGLLGILI